MSLTIEEERVLNQLLYLAERDGFQQLFDVISRLKKEMDAQEEMTVRDNVENQLEKRKKFNEKFVKLRKKRLTELDYKQITIDTFQIEIENLNELNGVLSSELNDLRSQLHMKSAELHEESLLHKAKQSKLEGVRRRRKEYVGDLEKKIEGLRDSIYKRELKYLIILEMLRTGYLKDPTYDVLLTLKRNPSIDTVERLAQVSNVNARSIKAIFSGLQRHGIVSWDMNQEKFHVVKELEI